MRASLESQEDARQATYPRSEHSGGLVYDLRVYQLRRSPRIAVEILSVRPEPARGMQLKDQCGGSSALLVLCPFAYLIGSSSIRSQCSQVVAFALHLRINPSP